MAAMADLYALILAGGASSRFWPLCGDEHPKYLFKPDGERSLLQLAYLRALACTDADRIFIVTGAAQARRIAQTLPELPADSLLVEPARRDTAAAIALGVREIGRRDPSAHLLVLPSDQLLEPHQALHQGIAAARARNDFEEFIHLFAVTPTRPEGGFGYIEAGEEVAPGLRTVLSFREKPGEEAARRLLENRRYLWNAGCFLFDIRAFDRELARHLPSHSSRLRPVGDGMMDPAAYEQLEPISLDFGLLERCKALRAIALAADFDDIGTWDALLARLEMAGKPPRAALSVGGSRNNVVAESGELVGIVGDSDLLVVVSGKRVLVLKKGAGQGVKQIARLAGDA